MTAGASVAAAVTLKTSGYYASERIGSVTYRLYHRTKKLLVAVAVAIAANAFAGLQRDLPGYSTALQGSAKIRQQLNGLNGARQTSLTQCNANATTLVN